MKVRAITSFIVVLLFVVMISAVQQNAALTGAAATLASAVPTNESYLKSLNTPNNTILALQFVLVAALGFIWVPFLWKKSRGVMVSVLALPLLLMAGCIGAAHKVTIEPNQVAFVIQLNGDPNQVSVNVPTLEPTQDVNGNTVPNGENSAAYWRSKQQIGARELTVGQYCFQANGVSGCQWRDDARVIIVYTTAVTREWTNAAPDASLNNKAFTVETKESVGITLGAITIAHVSAESAPLYLQSYGDRPLGNEEDGSSVMDGEVRTYIQSLLYSEIGKRSLDETRNEKGEIFDAVELQAQQWFAKKGIIIDQIGGVDGLIYDNANIQAQIDNTFQRDEEQNQAQSVSTRQAIENASLVDRSYAQATATYIAAESNARSIEMQATAAGGNSAQLNAIQRWNGVLPQVMDSSSSLPFVGNALGMATATPAP